MALSNRCQMTVSFGSNERGKFYSDLIDKLCKRYDADPTEIIRIAVRTLDRVAKKDAVTEEKI
jgi:hypothetical protein